MSSGPNKAQGPNPPFGAQNGLASAINAAAVPMQEVEVQNIIEIALDMTGKVHVVLKHGVFNRQRVNMMMVTAHQDVLSSCAAAERKAAAEVPKIAIAPPGSDVARNPLA